MTAYDHDRDHDHEHDRDKVVCEYPDRSRTKGNSLSGPVSWMTEHAPDLDKNTTYKTRQELEVERQQAHDRQSGWMGSLTPAAPPAASDTPVGGRTKTYTGTTSVDASRPSRINLGTPVPTAPAPSAKSPRTSPFGKNRGTNGTVVSQEEKEEPPLPSLFGPAKEVVLCRIISISFALRELQMDPIKFISASTSLSPDVYHFISLY